MLIRQTRIRNLKGKADHFTIGTQIVIGAILVPDLISRLKSIGFTEGMNVGDRLLPAGIGPISRFNAYGGSVVHKDHTEEMSKIVEVPYQRYPRTEIPPPSIELTIAMTADGQRILVAPAMKFRGVHDSNLIHAVNLLLEIIGYCQLFTSQLGEVIQSPIRRLNWSLLPAGQRSWAELRPALTKVINRAKEGNRPVIEHRMEAINSYSPDFVAIGLAGFAGYVVFGFPARKLFVLESIYSGNATYVFGEKWEELSRLTKVQVLDGNLQLDRIVHREGWERRIRTLLRNDPVNPR
jgi:hypothetical protein